ncbi:DNA-binding PadR family transcriptional regulator [Lipingzhangella halophila]|uniref:DNA-binding PadR family transcriptional regulator n=1 Tax=Lipingzhangella halophila TaxID=1783352 RepID=A0A7W7RJ83_9ACTN|nr:PadR family transcriptional regulator [Lipingzhangella halophila]MBB4933003.1 DNA-binding PadR family transcriptional regulator [Lipingzhangella halophila]
MSDAYAGAWPPFGCPEEHFGRGRAFLQRLRMAAERGGGGRGRGRGWGGPPGPWGPRGGGFGFPPGPKVRRGDVRASILALLAEGPRNGYQIIQEIEERSGGVWRPSAGSVYPALQQLEDEGLVRAVHEGTRRLFELTEEGRTHSDTHAAGQSAPWEAMAEGVGEQTAELHELAREVAMAAVQVARAGSTTQVTEARRVLTDTRRSLYRVLAEDEPEGTT